MGKKLSMHKYEAYLCGVKNAASSFRHCRVATEYPVKNGEYREHKQNRDMLLSLDPKSILMNKQAKAMLFELASAYDVYGTEKAFEKALRTKTSKVVMEEVMTKIDETIAKTMGESMVQMAILTDLLMTVESVADAMLDGASLEEVEELVEALADAGGDETETDFGFKAVGKPTVVEANQSKGGLNG